MPTSEDIETFLREQYLLWNDQRNDELIAYFRRMAPNGFTIEYVGSPPIDGEAGLVAMIAEHGGKVQSELLQILVNGDEAATYVDNRNVQMNTVTPSIETYKFQDGKLHVRYFH